MNAVAYKKEDGGYVNPPPLNVVGPENDAPAVLPEQRSIASGIRGELEVTLNRVNKVLAGSARIPELEKKEILIYAAGGPAKKGPMLEAKEQEYDAATAEHRTEVSSLLATIKDESSKGLLPRLNDEAARLNSEVRRTPAEVEVKQALLRYGWESIAMIVVSVALLAVGINTTATVLLGSGIQGLDSPLRAYLFSFVPAGLAIGLKGIYRLVSGNPQTIYARSVWCLGLIFGCAWVILFSRVFSGFAQSADSVLKTLLTSAAAVGQASTIESPALIASGVLAEVFLAAGCFISAQRSCEVIEKAVKEPNPEYGRLIVQHDALVQKQGEIRIAGGQLEARITHINENRKVFLNKAAVFFDLSAENSSSNPVQTV